MRVAWILLVWVCVSVLTGPLVGRALRERAPAID
jgi:hypothetical protein